MKHSILYIITKGNFGGAQRHVWDLATRTREHYKVTVASGEPGLLHQKLKQENINTITLQNMCRDLSVTKDIAAIGELLALFEKESPQIIHANSSKAGFITMLAGRIYNIFYAKEENAARLIFTAHGWAFNENRSQFSKILFYAIHGLTILLSHHTICVSEHSKRQMRHTPFTKKKMSVIHNGIDDTKHLIKKTAREKLSPHSPHKTWIGTLSELHTNKGLDIAIKGLATLLKQNPDLGFYIAGNGEERKCLEKLAKKLKIQDQVVFLGFVADGRSFLKAFDIFLLTSRTECFPYVLLEAGLAKVPIIATDVGGVSEIVNNLHSGMLIRPNSPLDVTHGVQYALGNKTALKRFSENLYTDVHSHLTITHMVKKTIEIYSSSH